HTEAPRRVGFSPDGTRLASGGWDGSLRIWDVASGKVINTSPPQNPAISDVIYSPDGKFVLTATGTWKDWKKAGEIKIWDAVTGDEIARLGGHDAEIKGLSFDASGQILVSFGA